MSSKDEIFILEREIVFRKRHTMKFCSDCRNFFSISCLLLFGMFAKLDIECFDKRMLGEYRYG